jgi:enoyl-CoA hydratase
VILTGAGNAFSAGADMNEAVAAIEGKAAPKHGRGLRGRLRVQHSSPASTASATARRCARRDVRHSRRRRHRRIRFPGAAYGLVVGGSQLPRLIGPAYAKELMFTARVVHAEEALRIGLVNAVVPHAEVFDAAMEMARLIAANSPEALVATKHVVDRATEVDAGAQAEAEANRGLRVSPEHHERFRAAAERVAKRGN